MKTFHMLHATCYMLHFSTTKTSNNNILAAQIFLRAKLTKYYYYYLKFETHLTRYLLEL